MDDIKTILTILVLVIPVVAKVIEKILEQAGKTGAAGKVRRLVEMSEMERKDNDPCPELDETFPTVVFSPETDKGPDEIVTESAKSAVPEEIPAGGRTGTNIPLEKPAIKDDARKQPDRKARLEIDPKKLIIYSEIMKPKF